MIPSYFLWLAPLISLTGGAFYIRSTLKGTTKPNRVSWILFALIPIIAGSAALAEGVWLAAMPTFAAGISPVLVVIASFWNKNAYWKITKLDIACGALSILAIIMWLGTKNPLVAIAFAIGADALAALPTIIKSWKHPETENFLGYTPAIINVIIAFLVIGPTHLTFANFGFSMYLLVTCVMLVTIILGRKPRLT